MSHIAFLIPGLDRLGGAERQAVQMAKGLRRRGWCVSMVVLSGSGAPVVSELEQAGVAFHTLGMRKGLADPRGWLRFRRWLRRERPAVVHAHLHHAAFLARWSRLFARIPVAIDTLHSSATGGVVRRLGYRASDFLATRVAAVSHAAAATHLQARMVSVSRLTILPNGVDAGVFRPDATVRAGLRHELGLRGKFIWLAAGRLEPVKDYPTLLQAMTGVPEPAQLLIAGSGRQRDELAGLCARLGLQDRIRFIGFRHDLCRVMQAADAFVLSSLWEGLPTAVLEAAACALPAVATDVPGTGEALADEETGYLAPPSDPAALAAAMTRLMNVPVEERRAMGARARMRAVERFSLESILDRWETLYAESGVTMQQTSPAAQPVYSPARPSAKESASRTLAR